MYAYFLKEFGENTIFRPDEVNHFKDFLLLARFFSPIPNTKKTFLFILRRIDSYKDHNKNLFGPIVGHGFLARLSDDR
jgi:hypothetical protein